MFDLCSSLTSVDLSSFNTSKVTNMGSMFSNCTKLTKIYINSNIKFTTDANVPSGCSLIIKKLELKD